jgi:hypothetical protein
VVLSGVFADVGGLVVVGLSFVVVAWGVLWGGGVSDVGWGCCCWVTCAAPIEASPLAFWDETSCNNKKTTIAEEVKESLIAVCKRKEKKKKKERKKGVI